MHMTVDLDSSPAGLLAGFRGVIASARIAYPGVLHIDLRDGDGKLWMLATQHATWSPREPATLEGMTVLAATVDAQTSALECELGNGAELAVLPTTEPAIDDPPTWELITPLGLALEVGPGPRWRIADADGIVP